jgi:hypothetical protein
VPDRGVIGIASLMNYSHKWNSTKLQAYMHSA